jgi:2-polyprenyl-6-methoxyphenol hydroxylase-like FAD-dependent oxidoreductase
MKASHKTSRRAFIAASAVAAGAVSAAPFFLRRQKAPVPGAIVGANAALGHALRDGKLPPVSETAEAGIVIVGGGIGGLAAACQLQRKGCPDFTLLELDARVGGNAVSGRNEVSAYPWGAHYVPIAGSEMPEVTALFEELGIIQGRDAGGLPVYNEEYLCADPMERLYMRGRWQEGFVPQTGLSDAERRQIDAFFEEMKRLQAARGRDGRRAFTIPLDGSSGDEEFRRLDKITMADYLREKGWWACAPLRWYVNYCCRDDYGAGIDEVSAWAGAHYFAARDSRAANAPGYAVVTWPEGNGWLARRLQEPVAAHIRSSCAVWNVETSGDAVLVDYFDVARGRSIRLRARGVVWAAPRFVAQRAIASLRSAPPSASPAAYSPWMVANVTLDAVPAGAGMQLCWDNVMYDSGSLGYVVATHQDVQPVPRRTVLTYYQPLDDEAPLAARQKALNRSHADWCTLILADLSGPHPDIADHVKQIDVWLWGHAMVRPVPGVIWGPARAAMLEPLGNIVFDNSDLSGISIFEEAYTRGVRAANHLLQQT